MFVLSAFAAANVSAQCTLSCNNLVQVSLDQDCASEINPDMILEGNVALICPNGNLQVQAKINNIWVPGAGNFVEVQGTAEGAAFSRVEMNALLVLAEKGIAELVTLQQQALSVNATK